MKVPKKLQHVRQLLQESIFLSSSLRNSLMEALERANPDDLDELEKLLLAATKEQNELFEKMVKYDDTFVPRIKQFRKSAVQNFHKKQESSERKNENPEELLKKLR